MKKQQFLNHRLRVREWKKQTSHLPQATQSQDYTEIMGMCTQDSFFFCRFIQVGPKPKACSSLLNTRNYSFRCYLLTQTTLRKNCNSQRAHKARTLSSSRPLYSHWRESYAFHKISLQHFKPRKCSCCWRSYLVYTVFAYIKFRWNNSFDGLKDRRQSLQDFKKSALKTTTTL